VGRVFGHIEIDRDPARATLPSAMPRDHRIGQRLTERIERARTDRILEARHGGLRGEARPGDRVALEQQFLNRIVRQAIRVIGIGIAARDPEDPLRENIGPRVGDARHRRDEPERGVRRFQQNRAAVRAGMGLVEDGDERSIKEVGEENSLWYRGIVQRRRLRVAKVALSKPFVPLGGVSFSAESHYS
jgi:hypothetical protein